MLIYKVKSGKRKLTIELSSGEMIALSENIQSAVFVKLPINSPDSVIMSLIVEFFERNLNKVFFAEKTAITFTIPEAIAFWQLYAKSKHELLSNISYSLADELIKTGVALYEKK